MGYPFWKAFAAFLLLFPGSIGWGIGTAFLTVPSDPRELALGGFTSSIGGDPSLFRGNPALIVQTLPGLEIYLGYSAWYAGARGSSILVTQSALRGTLGFGVRQLGDSDLELRTATPTDNYLDHFAVSGTAVEATWGRAFGLPGTTQAEGSGRQLHVGGTVRWIRMESYVYTSWGMAMDFGVWLPVMRNVFSLGASVLNLGSMDALMNEAPSLPAMLLAGVTYQPVLPDKRFRSLVTAGVEISRGHGVVTRMAGETAFGNARITLGTRLSRKVTAVGMGLSLTRRRFEVAYGLEIGSHQLGIPHLLRIKIVLP
ncbi:MAG: hypothetical protein ACE5GH_02660 [Fidelibacterota bacterium]